jgi:hypothetical protein
MTTPIRVLLAVVILALALGLAACGDEDEETDGLIFEPTITPVVLTPAPGDAGRGENLFAAQGCDACHALMPGVTARGPSLAGVARLTGARVPDLDARAYLEQSLVAPDAFVVEGFEAGVMPAYDTLPAQDLADLIAFLLTLDE